MTACPAGVGPDDSSNSRGARRAIALIVVHDARVPARRDHRRRHIVVGALRRLAPRVRVRRSRSSASRRRRRARATGSPPPTAASSPSATRTFYGSTGGRTLTAPIVGIAATPIGPRLLARRLRRRRLHLRRRALLRLDRRTHARRTDRRHRRDTRPATATGSSPPTAASSPSATPRSTAPPAGTALAAPDRRHRRDTDRATATGSSAATAASSPSATRSSTARPAAPRSAPIVGIAATRTRHGLLARRGRRRHRTRSATRGRSRPGSRRRGARRSASTRSRPSRTAATSSPRRSAPSASRSSVRAGHDFDPPPAAARPRRSDAVPVAAREGHPAPSPLIALQLMLRMNAERSARATRLARLGRTARRHAPRAGRRPCSRPTRSSTRTSERSPTPPTGQFEEVGENLFSRHGLGAPTRAPRTSRSCTRPSTGPTCCCPRVSSSGSAPLCLHGDAHGRRGLRDQDGRAAPAAGPGRSRRRTRSWPRRPPERSC